MITRRLEESQVSDEYFGKVYEFLRENIAQDVERKLELGQQHMMGRLEAMVETSVKELRTKLCEKKDSEKSSDGE